MTGQNGSALLIAEASPINSCKKGSIFQDLGEFVYAIHSFIIFALSDSFFMQQKLVPKDNLVNPLNNIILIFCCLWRILREITKPYSLFGKLRLEGGFFCFCFYRGKKLCSVTIFKKENKTELLFTQSGYFQ